MNSESHQQRKIAIVGAGAFGCTAAWVLAQAGNKVTLFEKNPDIFCAASSINQYRLHRGYHYPRSPETIRSCFHGEKSFVDTYPKSLSPKSTENYYGISAKNSLLSVNDICDVWGEEGLKFEEEFPGIIKPEALQGCFKVCESLFSPHEFRKECASLLEIHGVNTVCNHTVSMRDLKEFEISVLAAYAGQGNFLADQGSPREFQFELCEKPVFRMPSEYKNKSVVIIDGPFTCLDPIGGSDLFVMGNVVHAIHDTRIGLTYSPPREFEKLLNCGIVKKPSISNVNLFKQTASEYFNGIEYGEYQGSMFTVRTVLPGKEKDDARPTLVERVNKGIYSVFSGKISTCVEASKQLLQLIGEEVRA